MSWIVYAAGSAIFAALVAVLGKIGLAHIDSTLATTARSIVMAVFLVAVSSIFGKWQALGSVNGRAFLFIALSGLAGALSWLCYFQALKTGPATAVAAVDRTSIVMVAVLAALFLSEALTWQSALGSLMVVAGAILISLAK